MQASFQISGSRDHEFAQLRRDLKAVHTLLPQLWSAVNGKPVEPASFPWLQRLEHNVLPALDFDLPVLLVAICGGGSTGKSTLLNTLAQRKISEVGFKAGLTRRVLLCGHPDVLEGAELTGALLHHLPEAPVAWRSPDDALTGGPPLFALSDTIPRHLLLIDTPDFDTGEGGRLINRAKAEPILRTSEVMVYVFTNAVYNNLSNTLFMAETVGGIGGRDVILVYRISRAAPDEEVLEHCRVVSRRLYKVPTDEELPGGFPPQVLGIYRTHESDRVAHGRAKPRLIPVGEITGGKSIEDLLHSLNVAEIKRRVFAADLREIHNDANEMLRQAHSEARAIEIYRQTLQYAMAQDAAEALQAFPIQEAIGLTIKLFLETSPAHVKVLRWFGGTVSYLVRGAIRAGQAVYRWTRGDAADQASEPDVEEKLTHDLLAAANGLRNRLMDDQLIVRVPVGDPLVGEVRRTQAESGSPKREPLIETVEPGTLNLHVPVPDIIMQRQGDILEQDWERIAGVIRSVVPSLAGLPLDIEAELRGLIAQLRGKMSWQEKALETVFALLPSLPPLLAVAYVLVTKTPPPVGTGLWIRVRALFGVNDLWALVSLPPSLDLSNAERKQLEDLIAPVFQLWFERRLKAVIRLFEHTICKPIIGALAQVPDSVDSRFDAVESALMRLGDNR
ncbi:MAG: 50S ribosome-binding GTPase [Anaerolineae bacterium]|nr:50S ribosome-binding GTPase [Anaerolineae bacterium]